MGRRPARVARSIKNQVIFGVVQIALLSMISTLLTFFVLSRFFAHAPDPGYAHVPWWRARDGLLADTPIWVNDLVPLLLMCTPFFYIGLYTYLFARRFSRQITRPIGILVQAARKMQMRDLDFAIDYREDNEIGQLLAAFEDMRLELKESLARQWGLEDERREMLAAISHDLRTPVTIMQGHAELLEEMAFLPDAARRHAGAIVRSGMRITRLLRDFHTVTAIGSPAFSMSPVAVDIRAFLASRIADYEVLAGDKVTIAYSFVAAMPHLPEQVSVDADRLAQMMDNIQSNALRHTPPKGRIAWQVRQDDHRLHFIVRDSGPGFEDGDVARVLDPFYRSDPGRSGEHTGLGLYIVRELSRRHGGDVRVYNHSEGGAVVEFEIAFLQ